MPKETVNRRVQFTKTALRDAMIELICEKPLTSITVKDVCARADINRSTFYLHYKDVDSLLVAVEDYAIEYIQSHFKGLGNAFDELVGFLTYMKNTPRLRNLFFVLAGERGDPRLRAVFRSSPFKPLSAGGLSTCRAAVWMTRKRLSIPTCNRVSSRSFIPG